MQPLSRKKRIFYFSLFSVIFVIATLFLVSYATGYRLSNTLGVSHTGGFYVTSVSSGSNISVAGKFITKTNLFQRSALVQNLKPATYDISVTKDGYQSWNKKLLVFPERVTEAHPFAIKQNPVLTQVFPYFVEGDYASSTDLVGTTTKHGIISSDYTDVKNLFATTTSSNGSTLLVTATSTTKTLRKLVVVESKDSLKVSWIGNADEEPYYFCQNDTCKDSVDIVTKSRVKNFDFFPGRDDLLVVSLDSGIFAIEIDNRSEQNIQTIAEDKNLEFRVGSNGLIYIKKGQNLYSVSI